MSVSGDSPSPASGEELQGLLSEYGSLRSEIGRTQGHRVQIISLTVGAYGVILSVTGGVVLGSANIAPEGQLWVAIGGAVALYAIVIPSLLMMISLQQSIQRIGNYRDGSITV